MFCVNLASFFTVQGIRFRYFSRALYPTHKMPSFKKKQFKNAHFQKLRAIKPVPVKNITHTRFVMVHSLNNKNLSETMKKSNEIIKSTNFKFLSNKNEYLARTMPNIFVITEKDLDFDEVEKFIKFINEQTEDLAIDLFVFPNRTNDQDKRRKLRSLITHFKKFYKTTTFDDLNRRLTSLTEILSNVPVFITEQVNKTEKDKNIFICKGFLSHKLKTNGILLDGQVKGRILKIKSYESEEECFREECITEVDRDPSIDDDFAVICNKEDQKAESENIENQNDQEIFEEQNEESEENDEKEHVDSEIIRRLSSFKGIKDLKTCKIPSSYNFKPKKTKLTVLNRFCTVVIEAEENVTQPQFFSGRVDGSSCLLNVHFGDTQIKKLKHNEKSEKFQSKNNSLESTDNNLKDLTCTVEMGPNRYSATPFFSRQSNNSVHKLIEPESILENGQYVCTLQIPYEPFSSKIQIFLDLKEIGKFQITSSLFNHDDRSIIEEQQIRGSPFKSFNNFVKIKNMFNSRDEVLYFNHLKLMCRDKPKKKEKVHNILDSNLSELTGSNQYAKYKHLEQKQEKIQNTKNTVPYSRINSGKIVCPIGLNGCFKAEFIRPVTVGSKIWMSVYRPVRVFNNQ